MSEGVITISRRGLQRALLAVLALAVIAGLAAVVVQQRDRLGGGLFSRGIADQIDPAAYQAVVLTNGQVFFGKLQEQGDSYFVLSDVFYLSVADQPGAQGQLIKRGNEIHGPKDPMIIPVNEVLFIENLRDDSQVATAIHKFKAGDLPVATPPPGLPTAPTPAPATPRPSVTPTPTR